MVRDAGLTGPAEAGAATGDRLKSGAAAAFRSGDFPASDGFLRRYCAYQPDDAAGYANLLAVARRWDPAPARMERLTRQALAIDPRSEAPIISFLTGLADRGVAVPQSFAPRLEARPRFGKLALAHAICLFRAGQAEAALRELRRSLVQDPGQVPLIRQIGTILQNLAESGSARYFAWTICAAETVDEDYREAVRGLAAQRHEDGDLLRSIEIYRSALRLEKANADVRANLAAALVDIGEAGAAEQELRKLLVCEPGNREGLWLSSCLRIGAGDKRGGYRSHHVRWTEPYPGSRTARFEGTPLWLGQPPEGRRIYVWGDFGIGDEILFAPLAAWLAGQGASVVLEVDPRLVALAARSFPGVSVVARRDGNLPTGTFDFHVPSALLASFYERLSQPPPLDPWLADPERARALRSELEGVSSGPWIGLAWGGGGKRTSWSKSTDLTEWAALLGLQGIGFVSLQYTSGAGTEPPDLRSRLRDAPVEDLRDDLEGLAALIDALDCTVSISGVNAHFAGALRRPGFVLLPKQPLWFWGRSGSRSGWYPSLRLYRNAGQGWREPVAALTRDVSRLFAN